MSRESKIEKMITTAWMKGIVFAAGTYLTFVEWVKGLPDDLLHEKFEEFCN